MKLLLAGGGTGGHLFPAVALAEELKRQDSAAQILFVGTKKGLEYRILPTLGWKLETVNISAFTGKGLMTKVAVMAKLLQSVMQGRRILKRFRPDVVVGVGGYASAPLVIAAKTLKLPVLLHEQNAIPGLTNRLLARWADRVCVAFDQTVTEFSACRSTVTGNPLRAGISNCPAVSVHPATLLVFGGSRGASAINDAVCAALAQLIMKNPDLQIIHQTGDEDLDRVRAAYIENNVKNQRVVAFIDDMAAAYRQASLVVCRAGATTIAELTACGRPSVMIPYPFAAGDHQKANALALVEKEAALMLEQDQLNGALLAESVNNLLSDYERLQTMATAAKQLGKNEAAVTILDICRQLIESKRAA
jgi:UDP-N-acetylglucosamine--N-acetylmuramyl-(pentapeptide) pyrophosphoryl-undecaprenol N-acetylglucosamine transferase